MLGSVIFEKEKSDKDAFKEGGSGKKTASVSCSEVGMFYLWAL